MYTVLPYCVIGTDLGSASESKTVTISPGVTTGELMTFFLHNICSNVLLANVTYGGILTGGCHVRIFIKMLLNISAKGLQLCAYK